MNAEAIRDLLARRPFEPFEVHLTNGESHFIKHPECAALTSARLVIVDPEADLITICALLHVASLDFSRKKSA